MSVFLTNDELALFEKNGIGTDAIRNTITAYRNQGLDDNAIRARIDNKIASFNSTKAPVAEKPVQNNTSVHEQPEESTLETLNRNLETTAYEGIPVIGAIAKGLDLGSQALIDYIFAGDKSFGEYYDDAKNRYNKKHQTWEQNFPVQSTANKLIGGAMLPVGAAAKAPGYTAKVAEAIKVGVPLAAADAGLHEEGDLVDKLKASATGAGNAVIAAPIAGGAGYALEKSGAKIANVAAKVRQAKLDKIANTDPNKISRSQYDVLKRALGNKERVDAVLAEAKAKNTTLAGLGNDNIERVLQAAEMVSPDARITISDYKNNFEKELPGKVEQKLNQVLRTESGATSIPEMQAHYNSEAQPLYEQAWKNKVPDDKLAQLSQNKILKQTASKVDSDYANVFGGRAKVKADDLQYWDGVNSKLNNEIAAEKASKAPDGRKIRNLEEAKHELTGVLDEISPAYQAARNTSSNTFQIEDAYNLTDRVFNKNMTPAKLKETMGPMSYAEKDAVILGLKDKIINIMNQNVDPSTGFNKLLPKNAQDNIKFLLGNEKGQELIDYANRIHNVKKALNAAKGNSMTAVRMTMADEANQGLKEAAGINSVGKAATFFPRKIADVAARKANEKTYNDLANLILLNKYPNTPIKKPSKTTERLLRALEGIAGDLKSASQYTIPATGSTIRLIEALQGKQ